MNPVFKANLSSFPPSKSTVFVPKSEVIDRIEWLGEQIAYPAEEAKGDTFPITWADDGELYASAGDPLWGETKDGLDVQQFKGDAPNYEVTKVNDMPDYRGWGGAGPKPTGMISIEGTLYLAFQNMTAQKGEDYAVMNYGHGYDAQIIRSDDHGHTWSPDIRLLNEPMFPGRLFAAPAFINFGKDNEGARDGFVYAISGEGWDNGNHCMLGRVPEEAIMDRESWEWIGGFTEDGGPIWTKELEKAVPVLSHPGYLGMVDMVYLSSIQRYVLLSWHHKVKSYYDGGSELIIYDSPEPWGPFTLVHHEDLWETIELNPYNPRLPLKWFDPMKLEGWMLFSGSWRPGGSMPAYRSHVRRLKFVLKEKLQDAGTVEPQ